MAPRQPRAGVTKGAAKEEKKQDDEEKKVDI